MGTHSTGFNSPIPLSFTEIKAWSELKKIELTVQEVEILKSLSCDFCSQYQNSGKDSIAPYSEEVTEEESAAIQAKMRASRRVRRSA